MNIITCHRIYSLCQTLSMNVRYVYPGWKYTFLKLTSIIPSTVYQSSSNKFGSTIVLTTYPGTLLNSARLIIKPLHQPAGIYNTIFGLEIRFHKSTSVALDSDDSHVKALNVIQVMNARATFWDLQQRYLFLFQVNSNLGGLTLTDNKKKSSKIFGRQIFQ